MEDEYNLRINASIFDTNVLLDTLTRLINEVEGKRYYLRQFEIMQDKCKNPVIGKYIQWQDS